tara:strand:+ start:42 stop:446 length:405 start_codon:yes stop_codon:yes gene_type:complete
MKYDLSNRNELSDFKYKCEYLVQNNKLVELKAVKTTRTGQQNKALHKYFTFIADELNELGMEFQYFGVSGKQLSMRYNATIVKDYFWRPIQQTLFEIESTSKIDTKQMNEVIDVITKFFSDKGVVIPFPSLDIK